MGGGGGYLKGAGWRWGEGAGTGPQLPTGKLVPQPLGGGLGTPRPAWHRREPTTLPLLFPGDPVGVLAALLSLEK